MWLLLSFFKKALKKRMHNFTGHWHRPLVLTLTWTFWGTLRKASLNYPRRRPKEVVLPTGSCLPLAKMPSWTSVPSYFQVVCVCGGGGYVWVCVCVLSHVWFFVIPWSRTYQVLLSMEFPRQENWSGLPFPTPGNLPNPGIKPASLASPALAGEYSTTEPSGKP